MLDSFIIVTSLPLNCDEIDVTRINAKSDDTEPAVKLKESGF